MNVLISPEGRALLTDFGYSHLTSSSFSMSVDTPHGGTLNWLAPEVIMSEEYPATLPRDIWAFGMTVLVCFQGFVHAHLTAGFRSCFRRKNPFLTQETVDLSSGGSWLDHCQNVRMTSAPVLA